MSKPTFPALLALLCLSLAMLSSAQAADDEVDYVEVASVLLRDGETERAEAALNRADPAVEGVDLSRYHTVRGLLALEQQRLELAAEAFGAAVDAGRSDPLVHLYRAQAYFGLERYDDAVAALDAAGDEVANLSGAWMMRAHAHWMTGRRQAALDTLTTASDRFPANTGFMRRQVFYLIDAGLYLEAAALGRDYLARAEGKAEDYAAIGAALRQGKRYDEALQFLEAAALKYPGHGDIAKSLAQTWLESGSPLAAAEVLAKLAERDNSLLPEAAELFRRAGQPQRALALNARIGDTARKLKQRVGILVELKRYDEVSGMGASLYRAGLLDDQDVRYALAYALFRGGDFDASERHLTALTRPELFRRATELRRLMQECAETRWACV